MTSQDHVIEGSYDNMAGSSSLYVTTTPHFEAIETVVVENNCFNLSCDFAKPLD